MAASNTNEQRAARYVHELNTRDREKDKSKMSCRWFVDRAFYCVTPGNQMTHFYRQGTVDECKGTWTNMYHCFRASMMDEDKRVEYLKDTPLDPTKPPYSAGVWEEKETPGW